MTKKENQKARKIPLALSAARDPIKPATKAELRTLAQAKFGVSKNSFGNGWDWAIFDSGNEHWWKPSLCRLGTSKSVYH